MKTPNESINKLLEKLEKEVPAIAWKNFETIADRHTSHIVSMMKKNNIPSMVIGMMMALKLLDGIDNITRPK